MPRPPKAPDANGDPLPGRIAGVLKDTGLTGVIAVGLFLFLLGIRTVDAPGELLLGPRPWLLASAVGAVIAGRLALHLLYWWPADPGTRMIRFGVAAVLPLIPVVPAWKLTGEIHKAIFLALALYGFEAVLLMLRYAGDARTQSDRWPNAAKKRLSAIWAKTEGWLGVALVAFACALPFLPFTDRYILDVSIMVLTYIMLGWGLNIVVGLAGLLDLGYVAFYAVGAYSYALMATHFDLSFWVALPLAGDCWPACGALFSDFPVLRLRGDYLAIVTLAFGEIIRIILINWYSLTNGPDGISRIPQTELFRP